ncbi:MAG: hypothetical protein K2M91_03890, partial [Lachnospiraceae bacterium]|nr:hypothetical protein [Lachnospiraceae bacterium]
MNERFKEHITRCIILLFIPAIAALTSCKDHITYVEFSEIVGNEEYDILEHSEHENTRETYERFLNGELTVEWERKQIPISELFWDNDIEYCFWDIDGDNSEELHIRSNVVYYAIKVQDKTPQIIFEGWWSDEPVVTDKLCGILHYVHHYGYEGIEFIQINADGGKESDGLFYWFDENNNGNIDEEDSFHVSGRTRYEDIDMEQYVQYKEEQIVKKTGNELKWTSKRLKNFETWQEAYIDFIHKMQVTELV